MLAERHPSALHLGAVPPGANTIPELGDALRDRFRAGQQDTGVDQPAIVDLRLFREVAQAVAPESEHRNVKAQAFEDAGRIVSIDDQAASFHLPADRLAAGVDDDLGVALPPALDVVPLELAVRAVQAHRQLAADRCGQRRGKPELLLLIEAELVVVVPERDLVKHARFNEQQAAALDAAARLQTGGIEDESGHRSRRSVAPAPGQESVGRCLFRRVLGLHIQVRAVARAVLAGEIRRPLHNSRRRPQLEAFVEIEAAGGENELRPGRPGQGVDGSTQRQIALEVARRQRFAEQRACKALETLARDLDQALAARVIDGGGGRPGATPQLRHLSEGKLQQRLVRAREMSIEDEGVARLGQFRQQTARAGDRPAAQARVRPRRGFRHCVSGKLALRRAPLGRRTAEMLHRTGVEDVIPNLVVARRDETQRILRGERVGVEIEHRRAIDRVVGERAFDAVIAVESQREIARQPVTKHDAPVSFAVADAVLGVERCGEFVQQPIGQRLQRFEVAPALREVHAERRGDDGVEALPGFTAKVQPDPFA